MTLEEYDRIQRRRLGLEPAAKVAERKHQRFSTLRRIARIR